MLLVNNRMLDPVFISILLTCAFLIGELSPLILSNINDQWLFTSVTFLVVVFVCFPFWVVLVEGCQMSVRLWVLLTSLG